LDLRRSTLRRHATEVRLPEKILALLCALLERRGELISNEELTVKVWPGRPPDSGDIALNQLFQRLRKLLDDDVQSERYLRRLPGRGAIWEAPVKLEYEKEEAIAASAPAKEPPAGVPAAVPTAEPRPRRQTGRAVAIGFFVAASLVVVALLRPERAVSRLVLSERTLTTSAGEKLQPFVTDGVRIYFTQVPAGSWGIWQVPATGGESQQVATGVPNSDLSDLSPDGNTLLVRSLAGGRDASAPFWLAPLVGSAARTLGEVRGVDAAFAHDGQTIAVADRGQLRLVDLAGRTLSIPVRMKGILWWPRWSPHDRRIRFTVSAEDWSTYAIWEVGRDGTGLKQVLAGWNNPPRECCGSWSPDGKTFIFQAVHGGPTFQVWAMRRGWWAKHELEQLTLGDMTSNGAMFSHDGRQVIIWQHRAQAEIVRFDAAARTFRRQLSYDLTGEAMSFSPQGRSFVTVELPSRTLTWRRLDGGEMHRLGDANLEAALPAWSPRGDWIAFMGRHVGSPWHVYLTAVSGGKVRAVPNAKAQADPSWSPDGGQLAFGETVGVREAGGLWIYKLASGAVDILPGTTGLFEPRWSPRGGIIAAMRPVGLNGEAEIVLYDLARHRRRTLGRIDGGYLTWSRDGHHLYFLDRSDKTANRISLMDMSGHRTVVASLAGFRQPGYVFGTWVGLDPDDHPLVIHDLSDDELYSLDWTGE